MTSRKKIAAIIKAAKKYDCAVYLKTGAPGMVIGECCQGEESLREWVKTVKVGDLLFLTFHYSFWFHEKDCLCLIAEKSLFMKVH